MNIIETIVNEKGHNVEIILDSDPINPRNDDNLGTLCLFHNKYRLGDKDHGFETPEEVEDFLNENEVVFLKVYGYDHGGLAIRTSPFSCPWDSGRLGVIFVTKKKVIKEYGDFSEESITKAKNRLESEVSVYDDYTQGNVYGFRVVDNGTELDSCWGFYGNDHKQSGLLEAANS